MLYHPERLDQGIVSWLLEPDNPSVRYFALCTLLDRSEEDAEVRAAKSDIMKRGPAPAILALQHRTGWWGRPDVTYKPLMYRSTAWQLMFLAELGADPGDERVQRGCEYVLHHMQTDLGDFPAHGCSIIKLLRPICCATMR
jgi:hypothetical protein